MYTRQALLDLHERSQRSLVKLVTHCAGLSAEALNREIPGFGDPTVRLQLHHVIGGQEYWLGVVQGSFEVRDDADQYPTVASLEEYRRRVAQAVERFLQASSDEELNAPREMLTWHGTRPGLVPARVLLRTITHIYQHQGQVLAQCRLLGLPGPGGFDFPLD